MFAVTLGTQASGSTWLFNVVRLLLEASRRKVFSSACDDAIDALDQMPLDVADVVLKSHSLDQRLLRIARLSGAKIVVSTRDPRDSVISQRDRFGSSLHQASVDLSRAFATIASLPEDLPVLRFAYEDRFMEQSVTIDEIARFLGIYVRDGTIDHIFASLTAQNVRAQIAARVEAEPADTVPGHDPVTHWHPYHVGDGISGKWRNRLDAVSQDVVTGCLSPMASTDLWEGKPLRWSAELFSCHSGLIDCPKIDLRCGGGAEPLVWGPYLHLPRGKWRATPAIHAKGFHSLQMEVDSFLPWEGRRLAHRSGVVARNGAPGLVIDFDHHDHFQPVELRLLSANDVSGSAVFAGWSLRWLGPMP